MSERPGRRSVRSSRTRGAAPVQSGTAEGGTSELSGAGPPVRWQPERPGDHLSSTVAPTSSSLALAASASALVAFSRIGVRCGVDEVLGVLQAHAEEVLDDLHDLDLLRAGAGEHDVVLVLLLFGGCIATATGGGSCGHGHRCGSGDFELLFEGVEQFLELDDRQVADGLEDVIFG